MTLLPSSVGITAMGNMMAAGASGSTSSVLTAATGTVTCRMTYSLGRRSLILGPLIWARMRKPFSSSSSRRRARAARGASETIIAARQAPIAACSSASSGAGYVARRYSMISSESP